MITGLAHVCFIVSDLEASTAFYRDKLVFTAAFEFHRDTGVPSGWGWVSELGHGDMLGYIGIVVISGTTVVCYLALIVLLIGKKDWIYTSIAVVEIAVLIVAASGILTAGH